MAIREKIGIAVVLAVTLGLVGYTLLGPGGGKRVQLRQELATLQAQNLNLIETNKRLTLEIEALQTRRDYQEKVIREELGLIRPDEILVHLPDENPKRHKAKSP